MIEQTLAIIKPDAVEQGVVGQIVQRVEGEGFRIRAIRSVHLSKLQAEGFYAVHRGRSFFDSLTVFMSSGPAIVLALAGTGSHRQVAGRDGRDRSGEG